MKTYKQMNVRILVCTGLVLAKLDQIVVKIRLGHLLSILNRRFIFAMTYFLIFAVVVFFVEEFVKLHPFLFLNYLI